jgi:hypothetical protein
MNPRHLILSILLITSLLAIAEPVRELGWTDLTVEVEFEDPFEKLDRDQLMNLSIYARIQRMIEAGYDVTDGMKQEMCESEKKLRDQDVDIEIGDA